MFNNSANIEKALVKISLDNHCRRDVSHETLQLRSATPNELKEHGIHINHDGVRRSAFDLLKFDNISYSDIFSSR